MSKIQANTDWYEADIDEIYTTSERKWLKPFEENLYENAKDVCDTIISQLKYTSRMYRYLRVFQQLILKNEFCIEKLAQQL